MSEPLYIRVEDGVAVGHPQTLPEAWGRVSNPAALPREELAKLGWYPVAETEPPATDRRARELTDALVLVGGEVRREWTTRDLSTEERADRRAAAMRELRIGRNERLAACDWTQLADVPMTVTRRAAWATYRQALRDLPAVVVDPWAPVWPASPVESAGGRT